MNILVTGGAGFIGSHVADALLARGHDVHVMDDLSGGFRERVPADASFHELDIRSEDAAHFVEHERVDVLVHHAAQMDVRRSVADPRFDADVNVGGLLNLMEAGRKGGLQRVILASTGGAIYGEPDYAPQDEAHPMRPLSPYGITKRASELYLYYYEQQYGIPYVSLRYANVYGPRQNPHGEAGVVAIFTKRLLAGEQPYIFGDGTQTRDFVYVGDVVRANVAALDLEQSAVLNIGTANETSVNTLYRTLRDMIDPEMDEVHAEAKPGEQQRSVLAYDRARALLDWLPEVPLRVGLQRTVDWFARRGADAAY
jgi:UDP-glucose 4-epimerase